MRPQRAPRLGELLAGVAGITLVVSLGLPWYTDAGAPVSGFEALGWLDVWLVGLGVLGLTLLVCEIFARTTGMPTVVSALTFIAALVTVPFLTVRAIAPPGTLDGHLVWVGVVAEIAILAGALISVRDEGVDFMPGVERWPAEQDR